MSEEFNLKEADVLNDLYTEFSMERTELKNKYDSNCSRIEEIDRMIDELMQYDDDRQIFSPRYIKSSNDIKLMELREEKETISEDNTFILSRLKYFEAKVNTIEAALKNKEKEFKRKEENQNNVSEEDTDHKPEYDNVKDSDAVTKAKEIKDEVKTQKVKSGQDVTDYKPGYEKIKNTDAVTKAEEINDEVETQKVDNGQDVSERNESSFKKDVKYDSLTKDAYDQTDDSDTNPVNIHRDTEYIKKAGDQKESGEIADIAHQSGSATVIKEKVPSDNKTDFDTKGKEKTEDINPKTESVIDKGNADHNQLTGIKDQSISDIVNSEKASSENETNLDLQTKEKTEDKDPETEPGTAEGILDNNQLSTIMDIKDPSKAGTAVKDNEIFDKETESDKTDQPERNDNNGPDPDYDKKLNSKKQDRDIDDLLFNPRKYSRSNQRPSDEIIQIDITEENNRVYSEEIIEKILYRLNLSLKFIYQDPKRSSLEIQSVIKLLQEDF